jgi:PAS domain S-box-containing protein
MKLEGIELQAFESSLQREREANALLDALSQSAPVGLAFLDSELRFQRINSRPATMNGLSPEAHIGKRPDELLESDRDRTREAGFDAHLVKPVSWEELVRVLERATDA